MHQIQAYFKASRRKARFLAWATHILVERIIVSFDLPHSFRSWLEKGNTTQSLVLGGFDSSITPNLSSPVNFAFSKTTAQSLVVKLASISLGDGLDAPTPLLATPIDAVLDTSYPYFDLPQAACDMFAASFGLIQNNATGLFSVNSSLYTKLQDSNPSIIFTLKKDVSSKTAINISLPYASFDLVGNEPFAADATRYFPIRVAKNESQAILGRAFFQEAYASFPITHLSMPNVWQIYRRRLRASEFLALPGSACSPQPNPCSHSNWSSQSSQRSPLGRNSLFDICLLRHSYWIDWGAEKPPHGEEK